MILKIKKIKSISYVRTFILLFLLRSITLIKFTYGIERINDPKNN